MRLQGPWWMTLSTCDWFTALIWQGHFESAISMASTAQLLVVFVNVTQSVRTVVTISGSLPTALNDIHNSSTECATCRNYKTRRGPSCPQTRRPALQSRFQVDAKRCANHEGAHVVGEAEAVVVGCIVGMSEGRAVAKDIVGGDVVGSK